MDTTTNLPNGYPDVDCQPRCTRCGDVVPMGRILCDVCRAVPIIQQPSYPPYYPPPVMPSPYPHDPYPAWPGPQITYYSSHKNEMFKPHTGCPPGIRRDNLGGVTQ